VKNKINTEKAMGMVQVVELLPIKKALGSLPSITKKIFLKRKKKVFMCENNLIYTHFDETKASFYDLSHRPHYFDNTVLFNLRQRKKTFPFNKEVRRMQTIQSVQHQAHFQKKKILCKLK
jgi:hypothetical protein